MFSVCEWCSVNGERLRLLPFGQRDGDTIVILEAKQYDNSDLVSVYPEAYFVHRRVCIGADSEQGNLGCGILIRNILNSYKFIVLPRREVKVFFGIEVDGGVVEFKTGQFIIPYDDNPTEIRVTKELERVR